MGVRRSLWDEPRAGGRPCCSDPVLARGAGGGQSQSPVHLGGRYTGEQVDATTGGSLPYIVMELVEGKTLRAV